MAYIFDLSDAWAGGAAFTAIKMNVSDGGSTAGSLLMDLQVGGVSRFSVRKDGRFTVGSGAANYMVFAPAENQLTVGPGGISFGGIRHISGSSITLLSGTAYSTTHTTDAMLNGASGLVGWHGGGYSFSNLTPDLALARDAANTLAQRNGVNAQAFNLYNTYTDASNYERGFMRFVSNTLRIGTEKLGTGTARALEFQTDGTTRLTLATTGEASFAGRVSAASASLSYSAPTYGFGACGISAAVSSPALYFHTTSFGWLGMGSTGSGFNGGLLLGFAAGDPSNTSIDAAFARDAADTIAQRRGTNAQTSRLYGTYTDASNYRRLTKTMSTAGVAEIKPEGAGTGASGNVLHISGLPTSNPGPGILWNNLGAVVVGT